MSQSKVIILNLKGLYNILLELKEFLRFELLYLESEKNLVKETCADNHLIISNKSLYKFYLKYLFQLNLNFL